MKHPDIEDSSEWLSKKSKQFSMIQKNVNPRMNWPEMIFSRVRGVLLKRGVR
jgi:hypothetical protein